MEPELKFLIVDGKKAVQRGSQLWIGGSRAWRNCSPGNVKYSSIGYAPIYGVVKRDPDNFAIFKDYATGYLYLQNLVKSIAREHPNWTISQFVHRWAPASDNNDEQRYDQVLADAIGQTKNWLISGLL